MEDPKKVVAIAAPGADPRLWLAGYLRTRAHLAACESDFQCDPLCTRPGCRNLDLQVQVSIIDLMAAARHREKPVSALFRRHYSLGLFANDREDWIRMVSLKLKKPCPFLENDRCGIYPVRPLPCILFPEYLAAEATLEAQAGKEHFRDYLCLHRPLLLSPARARVMGQLKKMWERESLISSYYLFHHGPCYLDFGNLTEELVDAADRPDAAAAAERPEPPGIIPHRVLERFFLERIADCRPFAGVSDKVRHLQTLEGQLQFLGLFTDDRLLAQLKRGGDGRDLVFKFVKGKLQARRRSLLPPEYKYY